MTTNTEYEDNDQTDPTGESNSPVIEDFRRREKQLKAQLKEAQAQADAALADARAQVERENAASQLMSNAGFAGLADVFASDVDGDLTPEAATKWLEQRGLAASPEGAPEVNEPAAEQVGNVADLGAQIAELREAHRTDCIRVKQPRFVQRTSCSPVRVMGLIGEVYIAGRVR